ncbi:hypothetical protein EB796_010692 [Bugula neritina]|uniref:Uncharacterized protein n=1 Tax=Bugula neritina TaxID=10212 RepID=A0A7J7JYH5_BUGNE|nr:hypothetical protein EB796_010692 [Bugula neritina]
MSETKCIEQNIEVNEGRRNSLVIDGSSKLTDKIYTQQLPSCSEIEAGELVDMTDCHHKAETASAGSECSGNSSAIDSQSHHNLNQRSPLVISSDEDCENELPSSKDILIPDHGKKMISYLVQMMAVVLDLLLPQLMTKITPNMKRQWKRHSSMKFKFQDLVAVKIYLKTLKYKLN